MCAHDARKVRARRPQDARKVRARRAQDARNHVRKIVP